MLFSPFTFTGLRFYRVIRITRKATVARFLSNPQIRHLRTASLTNGFFMVNIIANPMADLLFHRFVSLVPVGSVLDLFRFGMIKLVLPVVIPLLGHRYPLFESPQ